MQNEKTLKKLVRKLWNRRSAGESGIGDGADDLRRASILRLAGSAGK